MVRTYGLTHIAPAVQDADWAFRSYERVHRLGRPLLLLVAFAVLRSASPCGAQTVIRDTTAETRRDTSSKSPANASVRARADSGVQPSRADSAAKPAAPAPAPSPPATPLPKGVCTDGEPGPAPDLLLVTFRSRSRPPEREAALKSVNGALVAPDPSDDAVWYVRVPSGGNEFALRSIADRLIRAPVVKEVGPVQCSARP
jgi:hypothetical protein